MRSWAALFTGTSVLALQLVCAAAVQAQAIAGLDPSERPKDAPVITDYPKDQAWYAQALSGVDAPYPMSLRFLEDQGAWFTPFIHPGMTGPYDIRGWHPRAPAASH